MSRRSRKRIGPPRWSRRISPSERERMHPTHPSGAASVGFLFSPRRPYSLALTAARYARFPEAVDRFEAGIYRRLLPVGRRGVLLSVAQAGGPDRAILEV